MSAKDILHITCAAIVLLKYKTSEAQEIYIYEHIVIMEKQI